MPSALVDQSRLYTRYFDFLEQKYLILKIHQQTYKEMINDFCIFPSDLGKQTRCSQLAEK